VDFQQILAWRSWFGTPLLRIEDNASEDYASIIRAESDGFEIIDFC